MSVPLLTCGKLVLRSHSPFCSVSYMGKLLILQGGEGPREGEKWMQISDTTGFKAMPINALVDRQQGTQCTVCGALTIHTLLPGFLGCMW